MNDTTPLRERKRRATRRRIEDAATALVEKHGFDNVTVEDICRDAEISRRTFFNYFETKDDAVLGVQPWDLDHDVAAALAALSPEFRAAVVLCDIEGLSYEEISSVLDVKIGTVRSRIHRGRAQLRVALEHRRPTGPRRRYLGVEVEVGGPTRLIRRRLRSLEPARPS